MSEKKTIEETINGLQSMIQSKMFIEHDFNGVVDEDVCERAIELLKEYEPRVLTLDEVMALPNGEEDEAVVVREFWLPIGDVWNGKTVCTWMGARDVQNVADWVYGFFHKSEYGHNWRCWTAMPTKAQREAAKWDD